MLKDNDIDFEIKEEIPDEWLRVRTKKEAHEFFMSGHGVNAPIKNDVSIKQVFENAIKEDISFPL